ncbi:MAG: hypothetical protein H6606_10905 [Flavobacteriales bacterium]|nr:hypothetical protein [Flavobacteriales bacterium]
MTSALDAKKICEEQAGLLFPEALNFHLESLELDRKGKFWLVTFRFDVDPETPSELLTNKKTAVYKVFHVEVKSGQVVAVKNRDLN